MILEFFGLPGSGKTVNMKELLRHYGSGARQILPDRKVLKGGGLRLVFTAEFFAFSAMIWGLWLRKKHKVRYDLRTLYHFSLLYLSLMKARRDHGVRFDVLDHGFVQSVSSLVWDEPKLYEKSKALFRHIERYFKNGITFIFTDYADNHVLVERIKTREYDVRLKHVPDEEAEQVLQTQRRFFAMAAAELKGAFPLLPIDSDKPLAENTALICRELENQG